MNRNCSSSKGIRLVARPRPGGPHDSGDSSVAGKPLNVEKARMENLLSNNEIISLISAIGVDIGNEALTRNEGNASYNRIFIMTDADVDGQHIRTFAFDLFLSTNANLVDMGHIYVARPPLYKVVQKKQTRFVATAESMVQELMERGSRRWSFLCIPGSNWGISNDSLA